MIGLLLAITDEKDQHILIYIYENYKEDMFYAANAIVHDTHLAEDIVQMSFERIINKISYINKISCNGLRSYTVLIVRSIAYNIIEKEKRHKTSPLEEAEFMLDSDDLPLDDTIIQKDQVRIVRECLNKMEAKYANSMIFRYYYGFSDTETAELMGISSASTVRSLCFRGRKMIKAAMNKGGDTYE